MVLGSAFVYLASRIRFILLVSELNCALYCDSTNTSFCCGIYVAPRDGGIVPVNGHVSAMYVNFKGSD